MRQRAAAMTLLPTDELVPWIIMALVAGFIILQLRRSLGRKGGYDGKGDHGSDSKPQKKDAPQDNIVSIKNSLNQDDRPTKAPHQKNDVGVPKSSPFYATLEKINSFGKAGLQEMN